MCAVALDLGHFYPSAMSVKEACHVMAWGILLLAGLSTVPQIETYMGAPNPSSLASQTVIVNNNIKTRFRTIKQLTEFFITVFSYG